MSIGGTRRWRVVLVILTCGLLAEWTARSLLPAPTGPLSGVCRIAVPAPAIGNESGASTITANYQRHPTFGWLPAPGSPHHPDSVRIPRDGSGWIAAFGDGVLAGLPDLPGGTIPDRLNDALELPIVSYAVAGHGLARIVARFSATLRDIDPPPRTALVAFRVDTLEHLSFTGGKPPVARWRSALLELFRKRAAPQTAAVDSACAYEPDRERLRSLLRELQTLAERRNIELVVSVHAPGAPQPHHGAYLELLGEELDSLAIHRVDAWDPTADHDSRARIDTAAASLADRLERSADYVWGARIGFGKDGSIERYPNTGFGTPHGNHRWMIAKTATLDITPPTSHAGIVVDIVFHRVVAAADDARELVVRVGDIAVGRWSMSRLRGIEDSFFIDAGIAASRPLDLRFELDSLRSLAEVGAGNDRIERGVSIVSLRLRPELDATD